MLRRDSGKDGAAGDLLLQQLLRQKIQVGAGQRQVAVLPEAQLLGDGHSGGFVVAGDHHRTDARMVAGLDGSFHLRPRRVDHAHQADEGEIFLQFAKVRHPRQAGYLFIRQPQHPQSLVGHLGVGVLHLGSGICIQRLDALPEDVGAAGEQHICCPLDHDAVAAAGLGVDGGHALAGGVEGQLCHPREFSLQLVFVKPLFLGG